MVACVGFGKPLWLQLEEAEQSCSGEGLCFSYSIFASEEDMNCDNPIDGGLLTNQNNIVDSFWDILRDLKGA